MFGKFKQPDQQIAIRDTLFGDLPLHYWAGVDCHELPWTLFKEAKKNVDKGKFIEAIEVLQQIIKMPGLEARQYLQASYFLSKLASRAEGDIKLYGVVIEVSMENGTDLLAIYADHSARYYNYSGKSIIWEQADVSIGNKIDAILTQGKDVITQIGPWKDQRPPAPAKGLARINFLTSHGLHFGEASQHVLFNDPLVSKIMFGMLDMMETLISKTAAAPAGK